jgi:exodeoxyribonuclease VII small subunit
MDGNLPHIAVRIKRFLHGRRIRLDGERFDAVRLWQKGESMKAAKAGEKTNESFEAALERLEKIVEEMESGGLGLEAMIARFEEGRQRIAFCSAKLNEVERRIEKLVENGATLVTEPLDAASDDSAEAGAGTAEDHDCPF